MKLAILATAFALVAASAGASSFQVTLDTSALSGVQTFGFGLTNFDSAANTVSLSTFDFAGGSAVAASQDCTLGGAFSGTGCSGDLVAGVALEDVDPAAAFFSQQFTPGSSLSFLLNVSNNFSGGGIPDQLAMYVCDGAFTACYSDDGSGALLLLDLSGGALSPASFATFTASLQGLTAPIVTAVPDRTPPTVPEPGTMALLATGIASLIVRRRSGR